MFCVQMMHKRHTRQTCLGTAELSSSKGGVLLWSWPPADLLTALAATVPTELTV